MNNSTVLLPSEVSKLDTGAASLSTPASRLGSWPPGIPLQSHILTTSGDATLIHLTERPSIEKGIAVRYPFLDKHACAVLVIFALVVWIGSAIITQAMFHRMDNMRHIGWAAQEVAVNGKASHVYVPIYITKDDFNHSGGHP